MPRKAQPSAMATDPKTIRPPALEVTLPPLHPRQREVFDDPSRFKVVVSGRQFGKTHLGAVMCVAAALRGKSVWWVAPTFDLTERGWKVILQLCGQIPGVRSEGRPVWRVTLPTGGSIQATFSPRTRTRCEARRWTGSSSTRPPRPSRRRGRSFVRRSSVKQGWAMFISTPQGMNWFHDLYHEAEGRENWDRWRFASIDSPYLDARRDRGSASGRCRR